MILTSWFTGFELHTVLGILTRQAGPDPCPRNQPLSSQAGMTTPNTNPQNTDPAMPNSHGQSVGGSSISTIEIAST